MEVLVLGRQRDFELFGGLHFGFGGDLLRVEVLVAGVEEIAHHAVERLAVVDLVVVRAGVVVDVRSQGVFPAEELEDRLGGIHQRRQGMARREAAVVLRVVGQQRRAAGPSSPSGGCSRPRWPGRSGVCSESPEVGEVSSPGCRKLE